MASYGTKEYYEFMANSALAELDSMSESLLIQLDKEDFYKFCESYIFYYDEYVNAIERIRELEATNVDNSDA